MNSQATRNLINQKTIRQEISYVGIGLHTGKTCSMYIYPAKENTGIVFKRRDVEPNVALINARWYNVADHQLSTTIGNEHGVTVQTVEHLMAALSGCGIDNARVELTGPEVPILDGSSEPFVRMIERVGTKVQNAERYVLWVHHPVEYRLGERYALLMPDTTTRYTVQIDFASRAIDTQVMSVELVNEAFRKQIAAARTFGLAEHVTKLRKLGLIQGASLQNAILVDGDRIVNEEGLRYKDEFVRHKLLDCYGDMSLAGHNIIGHFYAHKPGHELTQKFLKYLFERRDAWTFTPLSDFYRLMGIPVPEHNESTESDAETGKKWFIL